MQVARWYCPMGHTSFSLLPDCLASRLSGDLDEIEVVVAEVEIQVAAGVSIEAAAGALRPDIELPGALRHVRHRLVAMRAVLLALVTLLPGQLGSEPSVGAVRAHLGTTHALIALREIGAGHLGKLAPPFGLGPRVQRRCRRRRRLQHDAGPDPP